MTRSIGDLHYLNSFVERFPGLVADGKQSRETPGVLYTQTVPTPVSRPELLCWSESAASILGLALPWKPEASEIQALSGNFIFPSMKPFAARYGGHQFGTWAGQLGDGRAITLGEVLNHKNEHWEIQLKGAGPTPYSRFADGRAVLRSSLREFICSESMAALGVPTTRALCCVLTGDSVERDMLYNGNPRLEPGAITTRIAPTFLRFGNFQILAADGNQDLLRKLANYSIELQFPALQASVSRGPHLGDFGENIYMQWYRRIIEMTATMVAHWMRVGFVHGVMNTDNMSILGLTIDYGPYGWLDTYDPEWTPNTTDFSQRRYRFAAQPSVAHWNLARLGEALAPLLGPWDSIREALSEFPSHFSTISAKLTAQKLGLGDQLPPGGDQLVADLEILLQSSEIDMTIFFRKLGELELSNDTKTFEFPRALKILQDAFYLDPIPRSSIDLLRSWLQTYSHFVQTSTLPALERRQLMHKTNPIFIPRNYILQQAIEELELGQRSTLDLLLKALQTPYQETPETLHFFCCRPEWARDKIGSSTLSCSS